MLLRLIIMKYGYPMTNINQFLTQWLSKWHDLAGWFLDLFPLSRQCFRICASVSGWHVAKHITRTNQALHVGISLELSTVSLRNPKADISPAASAM